MGVRLLGLDVSGLVSKVGCLKFDVWALGFRVLCLGFGLVFWFCSSFGLCPDFCVIVFGVGCKALFGEVGA